LPSWKLVQSEGNVCRGAISDHSNPGAIQSDIQSFDNVDNELHDVMPAFWMHGSSRVQYERQVYHSATVYGYNNAEFYFNLIRNKSLRR